MDSVWMNKPWDMHVHLRQDEMLARVAKHTAAHFAGCYIMPNVKPPVWDAETLHAYKSNVAKALGPDVIPLMSIKLLKETRADTIKGAKEAGAYGCKLYPEGVTSHSQDSIPAAWLDPDNAWPDEWLSVLRAIKHNDLILNIHAETPGGRPLSRERTFIRTLDKIMEVVRPRIVIEHVSTMAMGEWVRRWSKLTPGDVGCTITPQHLVMIIDDLISDPHRGGKLTVHNHCWPCAKHPKDRKYLREFATSGEACVWLGTDSAPWMPEDKWDGCAGCFNAPVALATYAEVFDQMDALERLVGFASLHGQRFYRAPTSKLGLSVVRQEWVVPDLIDGLVPWRAGHTLKWKVAD